MVVTAFVVLLSIASMVLIAFGCFRSKVHKKITIYQMNYEFQTESPDNIELAGGMYITKDNWVMPGYPDSTYLIFQQDGDKLLFLRSMVENDCTPGTEPFTEDLLQILT